MPQTLFGTGGTRRELLQEMVIDAFARGHTVPLGGHFRPEAARQMTGGMHMLSSLTHQATGQRLIVCGNTKMGLDHHVCGR